MSVVLILVGLGSVMLVAAVALGLLSSFQETGALCRGAQIVAWGAAGVLVVGALLAWGSGLPALESLIGMVDRETLEGPVLSLILMAALAVPLRSAVPQEAHWSCGLFYLPGGLLSSMALVQMVTAGVEIQEVTWVTPVRFSLAVCGGLGAQAIGQSLQRAATGTRGAEWPGAVAYGLTTLVAGSVALVSLWQRGTVWVSADPVLRGGIAGTWLAWSASWLTPRRYPGVRVILTVVAAALLILTAIKPA